MTDLGKSAFPVIGAVFMLLAIFNFFRGENWIVWFILGLLFGGVAGLRTLFGRTERGS